MKDSIITFLKITRKKIIATLLFPLAALLILFSGFILDEILWLGGSTTANAIYSLANHFYLFILLPLTFVDDLTPLVIMISALVLTLAWWYLLSCALIFIRKKYEKKNKKTICLQKHIFK